MTRIVLLITLFSLIGLPISSKDQVSPQRHPLNKAKTAFVLLQNKYSELPDEDVFELAYQGWEKLQDSLSSPVLTIIDFSLPSTSKRMWVINPETEELLSHTVVSHGRNSGDLMATQFSNRPESFKSSLGFYKTGETYYGKHGYSLKLDGLEEAFNDQARNRAIVIHGSDYAREAFARQTGRLGRSLGCPAVPSEVSREIIDLIKDGSLIFAYAKDQNYLSKSKLLNT
ncbi:murein L,D-transpeptidase catalytic domain family protein [Algoriphagus namhaensis]